VYRGIEVPKSPVAFIWDLRRWPLRVRPIARPGEKIVYENRAGKLSCPTGGYTTGEVWWRGIRSAYAVDLAVHTGGFAIDDSASRYAIYTWHVVDPIEAVRQFSADIPALCESQVRTRLTETKFDAYRDQELFFGAPLSGGICLDSAYLTSSQMNPDTDADGLGDTHVEDVD
jgi:hypothetical protein